MQPTPDTHNIIQIPWSIRHQQSHFHWLYHDQRKQNTGYPEEKPVLYTGHQTWLTTTHLYARHEYCTVVLDPHIKHDIEKLEQVTTRAVKVYYTQLHEHTWYNNSSEKR